MCLCVTGNMCQMHAEVFLTCEHEVEEVARGGQHHSVCQDVLSLHHQDHVTQDSLQTHSLRQTCFSSKFHLCALETINVQPCIENASTSLKRRLHR